MDLRQLKNIIKEFEESGIHKLEITEKDFTVKMEKKVSDPIAPVPEQYIKSELARQIQEETVSQDDYVPIIAPLVGTFYDSPSPDSDPFVTLNQHVNKGEILFIVEAMKVMNEIVAPVSGVIKKINVETSTMVEYGQVVMEIEE